MRKSPCVFLIAWLSTCLFVFGAGSWNGVSFTHWNGIAITAWNGTSVAPGGGGGPSYLVNQNFEGTGYDNSESWTEAGSTLDKDYTTSPIVGSQSLKITQAATSCSAYKTFTSSGKVWFFARVRFDATPSSSTKIFTFRNGATECASYSIRSDGLITTTAGGGTANNSATTSVTTATDYYFWGTYEPGSGANAKSEFGFSTDGTVPTFVAASNRTCVSANGTVTGNADRFYLGTTTSGTITTVYDKVLVDDAVIGSNP